jgi:hypothetical protein
MNEETNRKLLAIFMTQPIVFIGFSLSDPDLINILRMVNAYLGPPALSDGQTQPANAQHFVILPLRPDDDEAAINSNLIGKYGIEPVFYKYTEGHTELPLLLHRLRLSVDGENVLPERRTAKSKKAVRKVSHDPDDPHKGRWGGKAERNGRQLSAVVQRTDDPDWFLFRLTVASLKGKRPLTGSVIFYLHPTFKPTKIKVVVMNGVAEYENYAYGAFTVGAVTDGGKTKLELNLGDLPGAPQEFKER